MLETGSPAPEVTLQDTDGQTVRLPGGHAALVYFMRSTTCPICYRHVQDLIRRRDEFADVQVYIAVPEDRETASAWRTKRQIPFPVLAGRQGTPHEMLGLSKKVFGAMQQSGTVLIDAKGVVRYSLGATMPINGYNRKAITAAVQSLRTETHQR